MKNAPAQLVLTFLFCFLLSTVYGQKTKRTGIGKAEVAGNISPIEAQNLARKNAKEHAIKQLGSFFISETVLLNFSKNGISELTLRSFMDEIRATHLRLIGEEEIRRYVEDDRVFFEAKATYEFDESRFDKEVKDYLNTLQNNEFNQELDELEKLLKERQSENDPLKYYTIDNQIRSLKDKLKDATISRGLIRNLDNNVESEIKRIDRYLRILDNYLAHGFIQPYLIEIDDAKHTNIQDADNYDIQIGFSYKIIRNQAIDKHYDLLPQIINDANRAYYQKQIKVLAKKYDQYIIGNYNGYDIITINRRRPPVIQFNITRKNGKKIIGKIDRSLKYERQQDEGHDYITINRQALKKQNYQLNIKKYYGRKTAVTGKVKKQRRGYLFLEGAYIRSPAQDDTPYGFYLNYLYRPKKLGFGLGMGYEQDYGLGTRAVAFSNFKYFFSEDAVTSFLDLRVGVSAASDRLQTIYRDHGFDFPKIRDQIVWARFAEISYGFTLGPLIISGGFQFNDSGFLPQARNILTKPLEQKKIQQVLFLFKAGLCL